MSKHMPFVYNDGGRKDAGFTGHVGDCVARSIAIATERPYRDVYWELHEGAMTERITKHGGKGAVRNGIRTTRKWFKEYMEKLGWEFVPTMGIGTGCRVHLVAGELPMGRLIVAVSKHYTAVIDGVVHDTHDPQRRIHWFKPGTTVVEKTTERCVYGYWRERN